MSERDPNLDDLIAREKSAWSHQAPPPDANLARLHATLDAPRPLIPRVAVPYAAVGVLVVLGAVAAWQFHRGTTTPSSAPAPRIAPAAAPHAPTVPVPSVPATPSAQVLGAAPDAGIADPPEESTAITAPRTATRRDAGSISNTDGLARELALLREAQLALRGGDPAHAIELAETHAREFPSGTLAPERRALERRARCIVDHRASGEPEDTCR